MPRRRARAHADRPLRLAPPSVRVDTVDGDLILSSGHPLPPVTRCIGDWLVAWAARTPDRTLVSERGLDGTWRAVSYAEALRATESLGSALLALGASPVRPVMVLADNGVDHLLLQLGAMHAGVPVSPVSTAYALASADFARLREVAATLAPGVVVVDDVQRYGRALDALGLAEDVALVSIDGCAGGASRGPVGRQPGGLSTDGCAGGASCGPVGRQPGGMSTDDRPGRGAVAVRDLATHTPSDALHAAFAAVTPDTVNKILFASGSTGTPKGVVNTHRMLCSNQAAIAALWPFLEDEPPVTLDWRPWSHTFGSNHNMNMVLRNGGTLHVDGGRPAPGLVDVTVKNLRDVHPSIYFNVPRGYDLFLPIRLGHNIVSGLTATGGLRVLLGAWGQSPQGKWSAGRQP